MELAQEKILDSDTKVAFPNVTYYHDNGHQNESRNTLLRDEGVGNLCFPVFIIFRRVLAE